MTHVQGASGTTYELETEAFWDNSREKANLRVLVVLQSMSGWRRHVKIVDAFIIAPDGTFVGE